MAATAGEPDEPAAPRPPVVNREVHRTGGSLPCVPRPSPFSYPALRVSLRCRVMDLRRTAGGALAGAVAAALWAAQQPLDKHVFGSDYDDVELLGKLVARGDGWQAAGVALHLTNGAVFGAVYSMVRPLVPGPPLATGVAAGLAEHLALWPLVALVDRHHPARSELEPLRGNGRAFAQATWRHALFGLVLGELERRLNPADQFEPLEAVPVASNGHGNLEHAAAGATESA